MAKQHAVKLDIGQRLMAITGASDGESALATTEKVLESASQMSFFLTNMGVLTLVVGPQGLGYLSASPGLTTSQEGLAMVEQALLDLQKQLLEQRKKIMAAAATKEE